MARTIDFVKMHGTGNDYVYIDCLSDPVDPSSELVTRLSDRHFGIGGDGVVFIIPSEQADFGMRMFNADGSEAEMCGNAVRCVGKYLYDRGICLKPTINLETKTGIKILELSVSNGTAVSVKVDMGVPVLEGRKIPVAADQIQIVRYPLLINNREFPVTCVSMGNPHAVIFVDAITDDLVKGIGPLIEIHPFFPARTNVEFVKVLNRNSAKMRVWERGTGETLSCGTGACAAAVAGVLNGLTDRTLELQVLGGALNLEWAENNHVFKSGPAEFVFEGRIDI